MAESDRQEARSAASTFLAEIIDSALTAKYAYFREHFGYPERFRLSGEAHAAVVEEIKRQVERSASDANSFKPPVIPDAPLTLYGIAVEVGDELTGTEVEAV